MLRRLRGYDLKCLSKLILATETSLLDEGFGRILR